MGNVSEAGWECLSESTRLLPKIYPEFDFVICYNSFHQETLQQTKAKNRNLHREANLKRERLNRLRSFGIDLYEQRKAALDIPHNFLRPESVSNHAWKLCPTRLRPEAHELWIDNDVVIVDRIPEIDEWLNKDVPIISTAYGREHYGRFDSKINTDITCCAGLFGLPPHFGFKEKILQECDGMPLEGFDEQGLVVYLVTTSEGWIHIQPHIFNQVGWFNKFVFKHMGYHFIRLNTGTNSAWENYKMITSPDPKICKSKHWMYRLAHIQKKGTVIQQRFTVP